MVEVVRRDGHGAVDDTFVAVTRQSIDAIRQTSIRHSMDQYYQREGISEPPEPPPNYDDLLDSPSIRRRFNIQPREDEGREVLPPYSCEISVQSVFLKKMELEGAVHKAQDRNWYKVLVTLQGTALSFHKYQKPGMFSSSRDSSGRKSGPDFPLGAKRGEFLRSYNLQHADVGIAADYVKKRYVIRVRAEADQFLLSCHKIETFVLWLQSLFAAIDVAPTLDEREIPRDLSVPRRTRRRVIRVGVGSTPANVQVVRAQEEIISSPIPRLAETGIEESSDTQDTTSSEPTSTPEEEDEIMEPTISISSSPAISRPASPPLSTSSTTDSSLTSQTHLPSPSPAIPPTPSTNRPTTSTPRPTLLPSRTSILHRARQAMTPTPNSSASNSRLILPQPPNPSLTSDGKWRPQHQWTHFYDMMYAKRCMAVLTHRSPRKSNLVIVKGKRWVVDWGTGKLSRVEPPDYGEVVGAVGVDIGVGREKMVLGTAVHNEIRAVC